MLLFSILYLSKFKKDNYIFNMYVQLRKCIIKKEMYTWNIHEKRYSKIILIYVEKINSLLKKLSLRFLLATIVIFRLDPLYYDEFFLFQLQWLCTRRVHKIYRLSAGPQLACSCFHLLLVSLSSHSRCLALTLTRNCERKKRESASCMIQFDLRHSRSRVSLRLSCVRALLSR